MVPDTCFDPSFVLTHQAALQPSKVSRLLYLLCVVGVAIALDGIAHAQAPTIDRVDQATGGQRGVEFTVRLEGLNLSLVEDVLFFTPGLERRSLTIIDEETLELSLFATDSCRLGEHPFVLTSRSGTSEVRTLQIGPFPVITEAEPNDAIESAQLLDIPVTVSGTVEEGDQDWYRVELKEGARLSAEVVALPLSRYLFDAMIEVFDSQGKPLKKADDSPLLKQDPTVSFVAPADGLYSLRVREAAFGGDLDSHYRVHVGSFPRPTVAYPAGVPVRTEAVLTLLGDPAGPIEKTVKLDEFTGKSVEVNISDDDDIPSFVRLRTSQYANVLEQEPNNTLSSSTAAPPAIGYALNGILEQIGDVDFFSFHAEDGEALEISVFGARIGSSIDSVVSIYGPTDKLLTQNDDGYVHDSLIRFVAADTGTHKLKIEDHRGRGGPECVYRIELSPLRPKLSLRLPTSGTMPQQMQTVVVPRGATVPLLVSCRRQSFSADVRLSVDGLPSGVTFSSEPIDAGRHLGIAMFSADTTAPLGAQIIGLRGEASLDSQTVYGHLSQEVGLVFGEPRKTIYHSIELDRFPIVVTDDSPFSFRVTPPRSPLVRRGQLDLAVEIDRAPGFDGDITLKLANAPPWVRGPDDPIQVGAGVKSAEFSLFADDDAEVRTWQLVLTATATTDVGELTLASEPFDLEVADPYLQLAIQKGATGQGVATVVRCDLSWEHVSDAAATLQLRGLPKGASAEPQTLPIGNTSVSFPVTVSPETPAAIHNTLFVEVSVPEGQEVVTHFLGHGGTLEVLKPGASPKRESSRLELLRQARRDER